jgi:hypothetical protein
MLVNTKHLLLAAVVLILSVPAFAGEPKLADFPLRADVSKSETLNSDSGLYQLGHCYGDACSAGHEIRNSSVWTSVTIDGSLYIVTGPKLDAGGYAARIKGKTLELLGRDNKDKLHVSKCRIVTVHDLKTGKVIHYD